MSILASRIISDAKEDFQGGSALSVSWDSLLRRAGRHLLGNINPDNLKLRRDVYGGITRESFVHFMPSEIVKPVALYLNDGDRKWEFQPPHHYFSQIGANESNKFTIASINGVKFLVVRHSEPGSTLVIDEMDDITSMGGTATPAVNSRDYISGGASIQASFTDAGLTLSRTLDEAIDVTEYTRGLVLLPAKLSSAANVASIKLRLLTDVSNYFEVTTTADDIEDYLIQGWNFIRFDVANRTTTGSPTLTNITSWLLTVTADSGQTITVLIDRMTLQKSAPLTLEGYSDKLFIDATTGAAKSDVDSDVDSINIDEELADILHYELCLLVEQAGNKREDSVGSFSSQLKRAYANYYENHPSEALPLSYNISPDLNRKTEPYGTASTIVNLNSTSDS